MVSQAERREACNSVSDGEVAVLCTQVSKLPVSAFVAGPLETGITETP